VIEKAGHWHRPPRARDKIVIMTDIAWEHAGNAIRLHGTIQAVDSSAQAPGWQQPDVLASPGGGHVYDR